MSSATQRKPSNPPSVESSVIIRPVESIAGSLVEEMRTFMFGRSSFVPNTEHRIQNKKVSSGSLKRPSISKKSCCEESVEVCASQQFKDSSADSHPTFSQLDRSSSPASSSFSSPTTPHNQSPVTPTKDNTNRTQNENQKVDSGRRKKKSKSKHTRKSDEGSPGDKIRQSPSHVEDQSTLPNHILIPTFTRVMTRGLVLVLISEKKQAEFTFWIDNSILKWGKQKQNGKEKGQVELKNLIGVEDTGPLALKLSFTTGTSIEMVASSSVEKSLLLRSFLLAMETGIYQQENN
jgi:hypothetical protein